MVETVTAMGIVMSAMPMGEYDKRVVLLTKQFGKITAFARGARRPTSQFLSGTQPMSFGEFTMYRGRNSYTITNVKVTEYFGGEMTDINKMYMGMYFLEMADYYGRENIDATETLRLLYQSLRALLKPSVPNRLVKPVYELKLMEINGEYRELPLGRLNDSTLYAWQYVLAAPVESLYTFTLTDQVLGEFVRCVEQNKERFIDKTFHSLDILNAVMDNAT